MTRVKYLRDANVKVGRTRGPQPWAAAHVAAVMGSHRESSRSEEWAAEQAVVAMANAIADYCNALDWGGEGNPADYVLGPGVGDMLNGLIVLLNGPTGRLDGGTMWQWCYDTAKAIGFCVDHDQMRYQCAPETHEAE